MKTNALTGCPVLFGSARRLLPVVVAWVATVTVTAEPNPVGAAEAKTHTLFMGADISVEYNKTMYRVESVVEGAVVINVGGKEVEVAADWSKVKLKVDRTLKLTGTSASVVNLKGERAYTPGNDPWENYQKGLLKAAIQHDDQVLRARLAQDHRMAVEMAPVRDEYARQVQKSFIDAAKVVESKDSMDRIVVAAGETYEHNGLELEGQESFDAMKVTFEVSSDQPLHDPYVVILGQFREKGDKPNTVANWFYARPLDPIAGEARKITLLKGGFPPGFEALDFQVHLYNRGKEIATDVAPKRVRLTRAEAHAYARIEYLSSHKDASLPAKPFMGRLTKEAKAQLSPEQAAQPYYVKVTKEGLPIAAFLDTACSRPVDEGVAALIGNARFYPALDKGKAIEGVAELKFSQLAL